jgi:hypothetical protein
MDVITGSGGGEEYEGEYNGGSFHGFSLQWMDRRGTRRAVAAPEFLNIPTNGTVFVEPKKGKCATEQMCN